MVDEGNDIEEGEVVEFQEGTSTSFGAMFNIVNLLLGVGALSLPYSVRIEGGVLRVILMGACVFGVGVWGRQGPCYGMLCVV